MENISTFFIGCGRLNGLTGKALRLHKKNYVLPTIMLSSCIDVLLLLWLWDSGCFVMLHDPVNFFYLFSLAPSTKTHTDKKCLINSC